MTFKALKLNAEILRAVAEAGYEEPTPIQAEAIPLIMAGKDVIGIAQTGTGKTAAFTLPILSSYPPNLLAPDAQRKTRVLIIAPTRELVRQIDENVRAYSKHLPLRIACLVGGVGEASQKAALEAGADIVIATPGRLCDLMAQGCTDFEKVRHLVLDEADRMLDMGFLTDLQTILNAMPKSRQTLMFSATFAGQLDDLAKNVMIEPKIVQIGRRANPAETVKQSVYEVPRHLKVELLRHLLQRDDKLQMVMVFVSTKQCADMVARKLRLADIPTDTLHADRSQAQRARVLQDFKDWKTRVLVATDVAARGIDIEGITHVVNFDFPEHSDNYVHRIGRTGRANEAGNAINLVTPADRHHLEAVEKRLRITIERRRARSFDYKAKEQEDSLPAWKRKHVSERLEKRRDRGSRRK